MFRLLIKPVAHQRKSRHSRATGEDETGGVCKRQAASSGPIELHHSDFDSPSGLDRLEKEGRWALCSVEWSQVTGDGSDQSGIYVADRTGVFKPCPRGMT